MRLCGEKMSGSCCDCAGRTSGTCDYKPPTKKELKKLRMGWKDETRIPYAPQPDYAIDTTYTGLYESIADLGNRIENLEKQVSKLKNTMTERQNNEPRKQFRS